MKHISKHYRLYIVITLVALILLIPGNTATNQSGEPTSSLSDVWTSLPLQAQNVGAIAVSPQFATDRTIFAEAVSGVYRTTDGGANWERLSNGLLWNPDISIHESGYVESISISPSFGTDGTVFVNSPGHGIFRSVDKGASWVLLNIPSEIYTSGDLFPSYSSQLIQIAVSPTFEVDRTVIIGGKSGFAKSIDGGNTWPFVTASTVPCANPDSNDNCIFVVSDLAFSSSFLADQTIFASANVHPVNGGGVLTSTDGGESWGFTDLTVDGRSSGA